MKGLTQPQIAEFVKNYPPLEAILVGDDYRALKAGVPRDTSIRVARVDRALLHFHGDYVDGERNYLSREHNALVGTKLDRIFVYGPNHELIGSTSGKECAPDGKSYVRVKDIIGKDPNLVRYIIVLSRFAWYKHKKGNTGVSRFGEIKCVEKEVVIYRVPGKMKGGMKRLIEQARLDEDIVLSTQDFIDGLVRNDSQFLEASDMLSALAKQFTFLVYNKGIRSRIDKSESKGMSGTFGSVKILSYVLGQYVIIILSRNGKEVTFMALEDGDPRIGVRGLQGTIKEVRALVDEVVRTFETELSAYNLLKDDPTISIH